MAAGGKRGAISKGGPALSHESDKLGPVDGSSKDAPGSCLADFDLVSELGRGTYGVVHKVKSRKDGNIYCLKKVKCGHLSPQRQREVCVHDFILSICIVLCFAYAIQRVIVFVRVCSSSSPTLGRC